MKTRRLYPILAAFLLTVTTSCATDIQQEQGLASQQQETTAEQQETTPEPAIESPSPTLPSGQARASISAPPSVVPLEEYGTRSDGSEHEPTVRIALDPWSPKSSVRETTPIVYATSQMACTPYPRRDGPQPFRCGEGPGTDELCYQDPSKPDDFICLASRELLPVPTVYIGVENVAALDTGREVDRRPVAFILEDGTFCSRGTSGIAFPEPEGYTGPLAYCHDGSTLYLKAGTPQSQDISGSPRDGAGLLQIARQLKSEDQGQVSLVGISAAYY